MIGQGKYKEINLIENATANGDFPADDYKVLSGEYSLAIYGTFDGATVQIVFFSEKSDGSLQELPTSTDFQFTDFPEPQRFTFPRWMPFKVRVSGAGASTALSVNAHEIQTQVG